MTLHFSNSQELIDGIEPSSTTYQVVVLPLYYTSKWREQDSHLWLVSMNHICLASTLSRIKGPKLGIEPRLILYKRIVLPLSLYWLIRPVEMNSELIPFPTGNSIIPQLGCFVKSKSKFDSLFPLPLLQRGGGLSIRIYLHSTPSLYLKASLPSSPKREKVAQNCRASYIIWLSVLICPILS